MAKIALVVPAFERLGGVTTVGVNILHALRLVGHNVVPYSLSTSWRDEGCTRLTRPWELLWGPTRVPVVIETGEQVVRFGAQASEFEIQRYRPRKVLSSELRQFDLIQYVTGSAVWAASALEVGPPLCVQVATTLEAERDCGSDRTGIKAGYRKLMSRVGANLEAKVLKKAGGILVENRWMYERVCSIRGIDTTFFALPGVDVSFFKEATGVKKNYFLFVGRMNDPRKNLDLLLSAYKSTSSKVVNLPELVLAGSSGPDARQMRLMKDLGIAKKVKMVIGADRQRLRELYQGAIALVLSSHEEGLGMVILEAFACGTGVIATDCGGPRELITNSVNGFLTPNRDEEALSEAMLRMAVDPAEAARIGKNARQIAENEYSLEAFGKRIDGAYRQFL